MEGMPEEGSLGRVVIVRPAFLTAGPCKGDEIDGSDKKVGQRGYRVFDDEKSSEGWTISRRDVAHFISEQALEDWDRYEGKRVTVMY